MASDDFAQVELAQHLSEGEIVALTEAFGGTRLYIPVRMTEDHRICVALGFNAALRLWECIGPGAFRVPIARALRFRHYRNQGLSKAKIARLLGMTETGVGKLERRLAAQTEPAVVPRHGDSF